MRNSRRLVTIGLSVLATGALLAGTASAEVTANAAGYGGTATSEALTIKLFGQTLTTSAATAELRPALAKATATQALTPLQAGLVSAEMSVVGGTKTVKPEKCSGSDATAIPGVQRLDITCGSAVAALTTGGGSARGLGAEVVLEPSVSGALSTLQLQEPLKDGSGQLLDGLNPLVEGLTGTPIGKLVDATDKTVADVLNKVLTLKSTVRVVIAPALAEVTSEGDTITAHARAQGIRIELLPLDGTNVTNNLLPSDLAAGEPLVTITIGNAVATKTISRSGGPTKADGQGPLVTIELGGSLGTTLGLPSNKIEVAGGQSFCVPGLVGTPLETCVNVASAGVDAQGNPFADSTSVQVFKGVNGGIDLATGRAGAGGEVTVAAAAPAEAAPG
ncbi:MAG: hypothetical protein JWN29_646, partial [Acidimicrobiales bacterium]|nr:hypothetical protein [Acidimicrobiales bacterium]